MRQQGPSSVPRGFLIGAACLIVLTIVSAAAARIAGFPQQDRPQSKPAMMRVLRFEDRANGSIAVFDAKAAKPGTTAKPVDVIAPESNGFIRATLRGLARKRRLAGIESIDFVLTAWADGRLTLDDPATGGLVELEAFGHTNEEAFARLLIAGRAAK